VHNDSAETSISSALLYSAALLSSSHYSGSRRIIDISGDGVNNAGPPIEAARDWVTKRGITINGLPIVLADSRRPNAAAPDVEAFYRDYVIGGPDAFYLTVRRRADFAAAIRQKLIREIAFARVASTDGAVARALAPANCFAGKR
jgi:hypothetical protein